MIYIFVYTQCKEMGVPLTITPPFRSQRPAVVRNLEVMEGDGIVEGCVYPAWRARVLAVEVRDSLRCEDIVVGDPQILTSVVSPPFDQVLYSPIPDTAV